MLPFCVDNVLACELQLEIYEFVGTVIIDEDFCLFKVGSGGKWGVTCFCCLDVVPGDVLAYTVEFCSGENVHWVL